MGLLSWFPDEGMIYTIAWRPGQGDGQVITSWEMEKEKVIWDHVVSADTASKSWSVESF